MLLERLDQAILAVIDNPEKTQQTAAIGTLFWQTLYLKPESKNYRFQVLLFNQKNLAQFSRLVRHVISATAYQNRQAG